MSLTIRPAVTADIEICGRNIYQAFKDIADRHRFPPDFPFVDPICPGPSQQVTGALLFFSVLDRLPFEFS
jgi:hypothetical protein